MQQRPRAEARATTAADDPVLTHVRADGAIAMVDVAGKAPTARVARAEALIRMSLATERALRDATLVKGDAFATAQIAGILAAKATPSLIPLAHALSLSSVEVVFEWAAPGLLRVLTTARATGPTGVELEAMTAASIAALTIYDMTKSLERGIAIERVRLLEKSGGKSGTWEARVVSYAVAAIVLSDRAADGTRPDACLPAIRESLGERFVIAMERILPDDPSALQAELIDLADRERIALVVTSGGTGLGPRDRTPQATAAVFDYDVPGIADAMRAASIERVPTAMLSRGVAGVRGTTLIVNLPGSPKAVRETLAVIVPVLPHALDLLAGTVTDG